MAMFCVTLAFSTVMALANVAPVGAQEGDAARGRATAQRWCSSCHAVNGETRATDAAPGLIEMGRSKDPDYLRAFLARPHPPMPPLQLSRQDIADIVAYIQAPDTR